MEVSINLVAVIMATLSSMVVGSIWYARPVFGNIWIKLAEVDMSGERKDAWRPIVVTLIVSFITAYVLAHFSYIANQFFGNSFLQDSVVVSIWLWLGFTAARFTTHDAFEGRPSKLTWLNISHEFVTIVLMGLIIGLFGV